MVTNDGPYQFWLAAKANFEAQFGTDFVWYFGESEISQHTAQERCVCVPEKRVRTATGGYTGGTNVGGPHSFDVVQLGFDLTFHIFGKLDTLFADPGPATQTADNHIQRVTTAIHRAWKGPENPDWGGAEFFQTAANNPTVSLWDFAMVLTLWVPVKFVHTGTSRAKPERVDIQGELDHAESA